METKKLQPHFECKTCDYVSSRKSSYDKHLLTLKHKSFQMETKSCTELICTKCSKVYKTRSGIWKHDKECKVATPVSMQKVLESNNELTRIVVKQQEEHPKQQEK
jgi:hypothetical protein